jgi:hypothetical protein
MGKDLGLTLCDLVEVFSQLERADAFTLRLVQTELARMRKERERNEYAAPLESHKSSQESGDGRRSRVCSDATSA